jgi:hypothetical protein
MIQHFDHAIAKSIDPVLIDIKLCVAHCSALLSTSALPSMCADAAEHSGHGGRPLLPKVGLVVGLVW